ncbi:uncharacterized protein BO95DRAFT_429573 [Aspergillus brunneoviolaceus CBS 621.78]|uniref:Uncharacterized protein n=1 Tax=Aspergillus brunneoviolaceus CBS 621.78 TaxID=1450534 RepID=A0ACD1GFU5_9EURO|nr:hypothetical protein BO95DRAFT_429573 [Aspergillus brunneoviolaceus CBS 621.78]RAH48179.1 hypothetical protein BO95DRAFT_429573 [Aspergillus brunneoviolaceus CBS 621.78]
MPPHHADLIRSLNELYTLLYQLGAYEEAKILRPEDSSIGGRHPEGAINSPAALAAGFTPAVVDVMYQIPYLDVGVLEFQICLNTFLVNYRSEKDSDQGSFEAWRSTCSPEIELPENTVALTQASGGGRTWLYDVGTGLMRDWDFESEDDPLVVPADLPSKVLAPYIEKYRSLHYLITPMELVCAWELFMAGHPPEDWGPWDRLNWYIDYGEWKATRYLKQIYLQYGWKVTPGMSLSQEQFRRADYLRARDQYWAEVVAPLGKAAEMFRRQRMVETCEN